MTSFMLLWQLQELFENMFDPIVVVHKVSVNLVQISPSTTRLSYGQDELVGLS